MNKKRKNDTDAKSKKCSRLFDISNLMNMMNMMETMLKTFSNVKLIFYVFSPVIFIIRLTCVLCIFSVCLVAKAIKCITLREREHCEAQRDRDGDLYCMENRNEPSSLFCDASILVFFLSFCFSFWILARKIKLVFFSEKNQQSTHSMPIIQTTVKVFAMHCHF